MPDYLVTATATVEFTMRVAASNGERAARTAQRLGNALAGPKAAHAFTTHCRTTDCRPVPAPCYLKPEDWAILHTLRTGPHHFHLWDSRSGVWAGGVIWRGRASFPDTVLEATGRELLPEDWAPEGGWAGKFAPDSREDGEDSPDSPEPMPGGIADILATAQYRPHSFGAAYHWATAPIGEDEPG